MNGLLYVAVFASCLAISFFIGFFAKRNRSKQRIQEMHHFFKEDREAVFERERTGNPWRGVVSTLGKMITLERLNEVTTQMLRQANSPFRRDEFLGICFFSLVGGLFAGWVLTESFMVALLFALIGMYLPFLMLKNQKKKRSRAFQNQLIDMLTIASNSLKAGYSFLQSLELLSKEMPSPMSDEFSRLVKEIQLGVTTEEALLALNKRVESADFDLVVTAVLIQRQIGGNLAQILDSIAETIRERVRIQSEIKTLTAQGRMSGYIFKFMPLGIGLMIYLINPTYVKPLFSDPIGWILLGVGTVGQLIGSLMVNKIVKIEV